MKDRNTQYRVAQNSAMACVFSDWIPGAPQCPIPLESPISNFIDTLISNARQAGSSLESAVPNHFGTTEKPFFLTEAQIGKVRGDVFETLCRALVWNRCIEYSLDDSDRTYASLSLGDNYDLRNLFTKSSSRKLTDFISSIEANDMTLSYSTPDLVLIDISGQSNTVKKYFNNPISNLSFESQKRLLEARSLLEGLIEPKDVVFAAGIKTSIRSDRMFQFLFEANAWKYIWRKIFEINPCPYFSITSQTFGADSGRLRAIDFSDLSSTPKLSKAIDSWATVISCSDLLDWFDQVFDSCVN
jgi:hypothetical protein